MILNTIELHGFRVETDQDRFVVAKEGLGQIRLAPAEVQSLCGLCSWGAKLQGSTAFPSPLRSTPFELHFRTREDGEVEIEAKKEGVEHGIAMTFDDLDNFILALKDGFDVFIQSQLHS